MIGARATLLFFGAAIAVGAGVSAKLAKGLPAPSNVTVSPAARSVSQVEDRIGIAPEQFRAAYLAHAIDRPIKSLLNVPSHMTYGDFVWNDRGVGAGRVWVRIDLDAQILSIFRGGEEIGTAVILYGADGVPTPTGKFPIQAKFRNHRSATYDGAPMPYTLRLTRDGVAIHGSNVRQGFATHGCIGVPAPFAAKLFEAASVGDEVMIVSGSESSRSHS